MGRWIKRLLLLLIIGGGCEAAYRIVKNRRQQSKTAIPAREPAWPPFEPAQSEPAAVEPAPVEPASPSESEPADARPTASEAPDWLPPLDGECPPGYPIKANDNSHIYHMPGGRFYGRPIAERCYATEAAAQRDGYRRAKS